MRRLAVLSLSLVALALTGCPYNTCDFPIRCVEACDTRTVVSYACGPCPAGSVPIQSCPIDAGPDAPTGDAGPLPDASPADVPSSDVRADVSGADVPLSTVPDVVSPDCGPADGPALRFGFFQSRLPGRCDGDPGLRSVSLYVHDLGGATFPPVAPTTISSTASSGGSASECPGGSPPCRISGDFSLTLDSYTEGVGATGSYTIAWPDGSTTTGAFDAEWCGSRPPCG